jgi:hypothetical protein
MTMEYNRYPEDFMSPDDHRKRRRRTVLAGVLAVVGLLAVIGALVLFTARASSSRNIVPVDTGLDPTTYTASPVVSTSGSPSAAVQTSSPSQAATGTNALAEPATTKRAAATPYPHSLDLYPVTALGSQATIDQGKLVTWMTSPTCLLAGHDTEGWAFLRDIPTGTILHVHTGPCAGDYRAVGHNWQQTKGGAVPGWMSSYALVTQSCTGAVGMGFTEFQRL